MSESIIVLEDNNNSNDHSTAPQLIDLSNPAAPLNSLSQPTKFQEISKVLCILEKSRQQRISENQQISSSEIQLPPKQSMLSIADKMITLNFLKNQQIFSQKQSKRDFSSVQASPLVFNTATKQINRKNSLNKNNKSALEFNVENSSNKAKEIMELTKTAQSLLLKINDQDERVFQAQMSSANELLARIKRTSQSFISPSFGQNPAGQQHQLQSHMNNQESMENQEGAEEVELNESNGNNNSNAKEFANLQNQSIRTLAQIKNNFKSNRASYIFQQTSQGISSAHPESKSQYLQHNLFCFNTPTSNNSKNKIISLNPLPKYQENQDKSHYFRELSIPGIDTNNKDDRTNLDQTLQELLASNSKPQSVPRIQRRRDQAPMNILQEQIIQSPESNQKVQQHKCNSNLRNISKQKFQDNFSNTFYVGNHSNNKSNCNSKNKSFLINNNNNKSSNECSTYGYSYLNALRASQNRIQELELLLQLQEKKEKDLAAELAASLKICAQTVEQLSLSKQLHNDTVGDLKGQLEDAKIQLTQHEITEQKQILEISLFQDQIEYLQHEKHIWENKEAVYIEEISRLQSEIENLRRNLQSNMSEQRNHVNQELNPKILAVIQEEVRLQVNQNNQENKQIALKIHNQQEPPYQQSNNETINGGKDAKTNEQLKNYDLDGLFQEKTNESFTQTFVPINQKISMIADENEPNQSSHNCRDLSALKVQLSTQFLLAQHYENASKNQLKLLKLSLISDYPEKTSNDFEQQYQQRSSFPLIESLRFSKPSMHSCSSSGQGQHFYNTNRNMFANGHIEQRNCQGFCRIPYGLNRQDNTDKIQENYINSPLDQFFPSQTNELIQSQILFDPLENLQIKNSTKQKSMLQQNPAAFELTPKRKQQEKSLKQQDEQKNQQQISLATFFPFSKQPQNKINNNNSNNDTNQEICNISRIRQSEYPQALLQRRRIPSQSTSRLSNPQQYQSLQRNQELQKQQFTLFDYSCPSAEEESNLLNFDYEEQLQKISSKLSFHSTVQQQPLEENCTSLSPLTFSVQQIPIMSIESEKSPNFGGQLFNNGKIIFQSLLNLSPMNQANAITSEPSEDVQDNNDFKGQRNDSKNEQFWPLSDLLNEENPEIEITSKQYSNGSKEETLQESFIGIVSESEEKREEQEKININSENEQIRDESSVLDQKNEMDAQNNSNCSKDQELLILGEDIFEAEKLVKMLNKQYSFLLVESKVKQYNKSVENVSSFVLYPLMVVIPYCFIFRISKRRVPMKKQECEESSSK